MTLEHFALQKTFNHAGALPTMTMTASIFRLFTVVALVLSSAATHVENLLAVDEADEVNSLSSAYETPVNSVIDWMSSGRKLQTFYENYTIPVYFWHAYAPADEKHKLSKRDIRQKYFALIRQGFRDTPFRFKLKGIKIVKSAEYGRCKRIDESEFKMKKFMRVAGKDVINIYICNTVWTGMPGTAWSSPPIFADIHPKYDGIVLNNYRVVDDRDRRLGFQYNAYHEVGHFLGLFHTFQGGCDPEPWQTDDGSFVIGDGVADTPSQALPTNLYPGQESCWVLDPPLNTCPDNVTGLDAGNDATKNAMNYVSGRCKRNETFTPGQVERMYVQYMTFRLDRICRQKDIVCVATSQCCDEMACKKTNSTWKTCQ